MASPKPRDYRIPEMIIPHEMLEAETLGALIEEFVTRDGTDLEDMPRKTEQVRKLLRTGRAHVHYDEKEETCTIFLVDDPRLRNPPPEEGERTYEQEERPGDWEE